MTKRTTCFKQTFWPPQKQTIESYISTFALRCFIISSVLFHNYSTLMVAIITENDCQFRLKLRKCHFGSKLEDEQTVFF